MNLHEMTAEQLKALQSEWYETAHANGNIEKLYAIARHLGDPVRHNWGPKYCYDKDGITVYVDDYGHYMTVALHGKNVVSTHPGDRLYIPGEWESAIPALHALAIEAKDSKGRMSEDREKEELLKKLSLPQSNLHPIFEQALKPFMP